MPRWWPLTDLLTQAVSSQRLLAPLCRPPCCRSRGYLFYLPLCRHLAPFRHALVPAAPPAPPPSRGSAGPPLAAAAALALLARRWTGPPAGLRGCTQNVGLASVPLVAAAPRRGVCAVVTDQDCQPLCLWLRGHPDVLRSAPVGMQHEDSLSASAVSVISGVLLLLT